jgi:hypothetical protein
LHPRKVRAPSFDDTKRAAPAGRDQIDLAAFKPIRRLAAANMCAQPLFEMEHSKSQTPTREEKT